MKNGQTMKWKKHRRSKRLLERRQRASGGWVKKKAPNLWVIVEGSKNDPVHVYVDLEKDTVMLAWAAARDIDDSIGFDFKLMYKGIFRERHIFLRECNVQENDIITVVPN